MNAINKIRIFYFVRLPLLGQPGTVANNLWSTLKFTSPPLTDHQLGNLRISLSSKWTSPRGDLPDDTHDLKFDPNIKMHLKSKNVVTVKMNNHS